MNRPKIFCKLFRFPADIRSQSSKIRCPRSQRLRKHQKLSSNFQTNAIGCVNTPKYICLPYCSFKICENPSEHSKSVRIVIGLSAWSTTMQTPNFRKYQRSWTIIALRTLIFYFWSLQRCLENSDHCIKFTICS